MGLGGFMLWPLTLKFDTTTCDMGTSDMRVIINDTPVAIPLRLDYGG